MKIFRIVTKLLQCRVFGRMSVSGQTARVRTAALALSLLLLVSLMLIRPPDFVLEKVKHPIRQTWSSPHSQLLVSNYSAQIENCTKSYRSLQRGGVSSDARAVGRTGYVLCLTYREQQTKAALSMFSLQCLAKELRVNIVEPFLHESRLVVPLDPSQRTMLAFGDLFSLRRWDVLTSKFGFAPLVSWRQFLSRAPRSMVVVHLQYRRAAEEKAGVTVGDNYTSGCEEKPRFRDQVGYLVQYGFRIVREVCVNFESGQTISLSQFNQHILGPYTPGEVSVIMDEWRGFSPQENGKRVLISDSDTCTGQYGSTAYLRASINLQPSERIHCEARNYQKRYLSGQTHNYISVMVRTEKIRQSNRSEMYKCLQKTLNVLESVQKTTNLTSTFLSMDIGKYGSYSSASNFKNFDYSRFIAGIYGAGVTVSTWESTFEKVSSSDEPGYVALLQKVLVAEARCLVMVGGGSFQKHAILLHKIFSRRSQQTPCIHIVQSCSRNL